MTDAITDVLLGARDGDARAMDRLFASVYDELRRVAHAALRNEQSGHTLSTTGLVHEAYFKLVDQTRVEWHDRAHFFGVAARAIESIIRKLQVTATQCVHQTMRDDMDLLRVNTAT